MKKYTAFKPEIRARWVRDDGVTLSYAFNPVKLPVTDDDIINVGRKLLEECGVENECTMMIDLVEVSYEVEK